MSDFLKGLNCENKCNLEITRPIKYMAKWHNEIRKMKSRRKSKSRRKQNFCLQVDKLIQITTSIHYKWKHQVIKPLIHWLFWVSIESHFHIYVVSNFVGNSRKKFLSPSARNSEIILRSNKNKEIYCLSVRLRQDFLWCVLIYTVNLLIFKQAETESYVTYQMILGKGEASTNKLRSVPEKKMMGVFDGTFILPPPPMRFNYCLGPPPIRSPHHPHNSFIFREPPFKELEECFSHSSLYLTLVFKLKQPIELHFWEGHPPTGLHFHKRQPPTGLKNNQPPPPPQKYNALPSKTPYFFIWNSP